MPTHAEKRRVPYSAGEMYALIADVKSYPEFLPWCEAARIRSSRPGPDGSEVIAADLVISFKVFRERFGSEVRAPAGGAQDRRGVSRRPVPLPAQPLALHRGRAGLLRDRLLRGLRVQVLRAAEADRRRVQRGDAADRARLRGPGRGALRRPSL